MEPQSGLPSPSPRDPLLSPESHMVRTSTGYYVCNSELDIDKKSKDNTANMSKVAECLLTDGHAEAVVLVCASLA